jgi:hypothetical protein
LQTGPDLACQEWLERSVRFGYVLGTFQDNLIYSVSYDGWTTPNLSNMSLGCAQSI